MTNDVYTPLPEIDPDIIVRWMEKLEDYPLPDSPWNPPSYARKTLTERIEPWATEYDQLAREHPDYYDCPECSGPNPEFYQPATRLIALDRKLDRLKARGFREVPNPDYDAARAEAWREKWRSPYNSTTIMTGQSYHPAKGD